MAAEIVLSRQEILFADDDLVAVDKPAGVLSDATRDPNRDHLGKALKRWADQPDSEFLPVHRLDLGTSGVVLFARNRPSATAAMQQFQDRSVAKRYHAIVCPPDPYSWSPGATFHRRSYLRHHKGTSEEVRSGGKPAESDFTVLDASGDLALVDAAPKTGRTHQLRVHLAGLGAPIAGDDRYGTGPQDRLWLHACCLQLAHPTTNEPLTIRSRWALGLLGGIATVVPNPEHR